MPYYPVLKSEMARRGISELQIQRLLGISQKTLYNKMNGRSAFTWPEVQLIRRNYFPDIGYDELFYTHE